MKKHCFLLTVFYSIMCVAFTVGALAAEPANPPFPRLGMWWLDANNEPPERIARYDFLCNEFETEDLPEKLDVARKINPALAVFRPFSPTETGWFSGKKPHPVTSVLPSSFFLQKIGSALAGEIDAEATVLRVERVEDGSGAQLFHRGATVVIGENESAKVLAVDRKKKTLSVKRGWVRAASPHGVGERVAEHVTFWPKTWVMNLAESCPRAELLGSGGKVNWLEYYFTFVVNQHHPALGRVENEVFMDCARVRYDGILFDRFEDHESWLASSVDDGEFDLDMNHNNRRVTAAEFDASWQKGTDRLRDLFAERFPGIPIIRNNPLTVRFSEYNGQVYETGGWGKPSLEWWERYFVTTTHDDGYEDAYFVGCYLDWFKKGKKPVYVMVEVYEDEGMPDKSGGHSNPLEKKNFVPNYKRMRFALASTLMGDGYFSYEASTATHGAGGLMWFDEYDNAGAGKGYLGYPKGEAVKLENGVWRRDFDNGIVLVNPQPKPCLMRLEKVFRRMKGAQVPRLHNGQAIQSFSMPSFDGLILLNESQRSVFSKDLSGGDNVR